MDTGLTNLAEAEPLTAMQQDSGSVTQELLLIHQGLIIDLGYS